MADGSNLKAKIGMDTGDFEKGAKKVVKAAQGMGKDIGSSLSEVGRAIGVDAGLLGDLAKRIDQATTLFKGMATAGGNAASSLTKAMAGLGGAIAGLGLTAAIMGFRELNEQAQNFEQRLQGVNLAASAKAYRDTYAQSLYDASGAGEAVAGFWERSKNYFATNMAEIGTLFTTNSADRAKAKSDAERAAQLASDMVDLRRRERDLGIEIQQITNDISAAQNTYLDKSASIADRKQAEATITELVTQKYAKQIALQQEMLANVQERNSLTSSTEAELDEEAGLQKNILSLQGQCQQELNSMLRAHNQIAGATKSQATSAKETQTATELTLEAAIELVKQERALQEIQKQNSAMRAAAMRQLDTEAGKWSLGAISTPGNLTPGAQKGGIEVPLKPVVQKEGVEAAMLELSDLVADAAVGMSEALGDLIGNLINGENAWQNFAQAGISVVANMLSTVGKAFITEGVGVEAAKLALETGNGVGAIAAGAAMVALAAAMKTTMSNAAANWGGGGYSSSVASSGYSSGTLAAGAVTQTVQVKVTGTLVGEGSKLKAVLNNEDRRTNVTT